ncbi:hypothetical protein F4819DRAFT_442914 [Hypoxylon fuscum]|nr:hypothetical protein F4819DRAFT_442914 [Hypoxylon fuscum]
MNSIIPEDVFQQIPILQGVDNVKDWKAGVLAHLRDKKLEKYVLEGVAFPPLDSSERDNFELVRPYVKIILSRTISADAENMLQQKSPGWKKCPKGLKGMWDLIAATFPEDPNTTLDDLIQKLCRMDVKEYYSLADFIVDMQGTKKDIEAIAPKAQVLDVATRLLVATIKDYDKQWHARLHHQFTHCGLDWKSLAAQIAVRSKEDYGIKMFTKPGGHQVAPSACGTFEQQTNPVPDIPKSISGPVPGQKRKAAEHDPRGFTSSAAAPETPSGKLIKREKFD